MPERDRYNERILAGLCTNCGTEAAEPGYVRCPSCREVAKVRESSRRDDRVKKGLCRTCGKQPPREGSPDCQDCLDNYARLQRAKK